jgi:two-component system, NarL family, sensor histidine kinase UhpB
MTKTFSKFFKISIIGFLLFIISIILSIYLLPEFFNSGIKIPTQFLVLTCMILFLSMLFIIFAFLISKRYKLIIARTNSDNLKRYEALSNATNDAIWEYDLITKNVTYNERIKAVFGYADDDLRNNTSWWEGNLHPNIKERVIANVENHLRESVNAWEDEYEFKCSDGTYKMVYDRSYIVRDINGKPLRLIGAMKDITHFRQIEKEYHQLQLRNKNIVGKNIINAHEIEKRQFRDQLQEDVNQILASIKFYINKYKSENEYISTSVTYLDEAIAKIRVISNRLFSSTLELFGLKEAVLELTDRYKNEQALTIEFEMFQLSNDEIDNSLSLYLFRIIEDSVSKISTLTQARLIKIRLEKVTAKILLKIAIACSKEELALLENDFLSSSLNSKIEIYESQPSVVDLGNGWYELNILT